MWKSAKRDEFIPLDAPVAGYEIGVPGIKEPSPLFIIRAKVNGGIHPGKGCSAIRHGSHGEEESTFVMNLKFTWAL